MNKYPFVVTVYRVPGGNKPHIQQHSFDDLVLAQLKMGTFEHDRSVISVRLTVTLAEKNFTSRFPRHGE